LGPDGESISGSSAVEVNQGKGNTLLSRNAQQTLRKIRALKKALSDNSVLEELAMIYGSEDSLYLVTGEKKPLAQEVFLDHEEFASSSTKTDNLQEHAIRAPDNAQEDVIMQNVIKEAQKSSQDLGTLSSTTIKKSLQGLKKRKESRSQD
jgi:hypothetical protein